MKTIIENVIKSGRYELADILKKIDTIWLQGSISDGERDELVTLARANATSEMGYAAVEQRLASIEARLTALEESPAYVTDDEEFPEYKQPTGAHDAYYTGDKITYNGRKYICSAPEGYGVSYPPDILPGMWEEI